MRFINRKDFDIPEILIGNEAKYFNKEIKDFLKYNHNFEKAPKPDEYIFNEIKSYLYDVFDGNCAYCETSVDRNEIILDHFRPIYGAERFKGKVDRLHYSWLALDWNNMYLSCHECNKYKSNLFPVKETGKIGATISSLRLSEDAFLIDPCFDKPEEHININLDGEFVSVTEKGKVTIDILNLNRENLIIKRREKVKEFKYLWYKLVHNKPTYVIDDFVKLLTESKDYSGTSYLILKQISRFFGYPKKLYYKLNRNTIYKIFSFYSNRGYNDFENMLSLSVNDFSYSEDLEINKSYYIKSVSIQNFKGIKECKLDFSLSSKKDNALCKTIIGKNTIGKTTILQAIALGILGHRNAYLSGITPDECLSKSNESGQIEVSFHGEKEKNIIKFNRYSDQFYGESNIDTLLLGYGAYRLPARGMLSKTKRDNNYRVQSLFDERELINGPLGLFDKYRDRHVDIATSIKELLKHDDIDVDIVNNTLEIIHHGNSLKLEKFSSGYKSIISFVTDIMDVLYRNTESMQAARGIVLVDEIDAHLHPEWRLRIIYSLRNLFPNVQFIFTTHDPLILRGLTYDEITILQKDSNGNINTLQTAPDVMNKLDIDQMLTSIFGLESTMNSDIENNLAIYYSLLSIGEENLNTKQTNELNNLKRQLDNYNILGNTKRERLMYKLIDIELSKMKDETFDEWSEDSVSKLTSKLSEKLRLADND